VKSGGNRRARIANACPALSLASIDNIQGNSWLQDLVAFLGEVHAQGVDLYLDRQGVDTTTPGGKALFQMMGVFAEFERAMIRERLCAGLDKARARGKRLGRPRWARPSRTPFARLGRPARASWRLPATLALG
jgi:DNA invertase Pin-like site-specific DNA recombinase